MNSYAPLHPSSHVCIKTTLKTPLKKTEMDVKVIVQITRGDPAGWQAEVDKSVIIRSPVSSLHIYVFQMIRSVYASTQRPLLALIG